MFVNAICTATPRQRYTKAERWQAFAQLDWFKWLDARALAVARAVPTRDNGIAERYLALDTLDDVFNINADVLQSRLLLAPTLK